MKKYFVISDIHSFYDEMIECLNKKGYDKDNPDHILIVCGDAWDRGTQPLEVYNFLISIPRERRILIRGNHEVLLNQLVERKHYEMHDIHNGTADTLFLIKYNKTLDEFDYDYYDKLGKSSLTEWSSADWDLIRDNKAILVSKIYEGKIKEILDWIYSDEWVNYYETNNYIFVHSWIPVKEHIDFNKSLTHGIIIKTGADTYREDWRNATQTEWDDAMWPCPWKNAKAGLNKTGKTIVCGHWHTSDFFNNLSKSKNKKDINHNPIFISKRYKLIGLDACTVVTYKINVLVINEEDL